MTKTSGKPDQIFDLAIGREEDAHRFYLALADRVRNASTKETFQSLAKDELAHKAMLTVLKNDPELQSKLKPSPNYHVAETEAEPPVSSDMPLRDALALAMKKEQQAVTFYHGLAAVATDDATRKLFENLMNMELGHKNKLEAMFVDIAYPEKF